MTIRKEISKGEFDKITEEGRSAALDVIGLERNYGIKSYRAYEENGTYWVLVKV